MNLEVVSISILVYMYFLLVETVAHGYHIYQQVLWEPHVGENFIALHESGNGQPESWAIYHEKSQRPVTILQGMMLKSVGE